MKYYKLDGQVYAFESDGSQDQYIKPEMVELSDAEKAAHLAPPKDIERALADKLQEVDIKAQEKIEAGFDSSALGSSHKYDCRRGLDATDLALAMEIAAETVASVDYMAQATGQHFADHAHTLTELRSVATDMRSHVQGHRVIARTKKSAATNARNANDLAGIEAVDVTDWN